jgi:hypothetical protein
LIVGSILTLCSCKNKEGDTKEETRPFSVVAQKIEENSYASNISVSGNIEGNKTVRLGFMVAGKIDRINVNEGQNVGQGQLIATLDPSNCSIAKEITDVQVNQASDEYSRLKLMHYRNSLSESDFKKSTLPCKVPKHNKNYWVKILPIHIYILQSAEYYYANWQSVGKLFQPERLYWLYPISTG